MKVFRALLPKRNEHQLYHLLDTILVISIQFTLTYWSPLSDLYKISSTRLQYWMILLPNLKPIYWEKIRTIELFMWIQSSKRKWFSSSRMPYSKHQTWSCLRKHVKSSQGILENPWNQFRTISCMCQRINGPAERLIQENWTRSLAIYQTVSELKMCFMVIGWETDCRHFALMAKRRLKYGITKLGWTILSFSNSELHTLP